MAASPAFHQCLANSINGVGAPLWNGASIAPYRQCNGDPGWGSTREAQLATALMVTHSANDLAINCSGGGGLASTYIGSYGHLDAESLSFSRWLGDVVGTLDQPLCGTPGAPVGSCRGAPAPWPITQAAGTIWHEAAHTHGYTHGANDQENAKVACGYADDPSWNFQFNTMPYIIGNCVDMVIYHSGVSCGSDLHAGCPSGELRLVDATSAGTCSCVHDPRSNGLGLVKLSGAALSSYEIIDPEDWLGSWHYGSANSIAGVGDFDNDGRSDFVIRSAVGIGIVKRNVGGGFSTLANIAWGTELAPGFALNARDKVLAVGDFDSNPKDDILLRTASGLALLTSSPGSASGFSISSRVAWSTSATGWPHASDRFEGFGDFDGDGIWDFLERDGNRLAIARMSSVSGLPFVTTSAVANSGDWLGSWHWGGTEKILGTGDFDGDGRKDFLLKSAGNIGTLKFSDGRLTTLNNVAFGSFWGSWGTNASDRFVGIGDVNGDGRSDIVWESVWGLGVNSRSATGAAITLGGIPTDTWLGSWHYGPDLTYLGLADLNGDHRADLVVRSPSAVGVFKGLETGSFGLAAANAMKDLMGSWQVRPTDVFLTPGDFDGDGKQDLFLQR